jgi:D-alanyl-D-alanine carboxypeptidase
MLRIFSALVFAMLPITAYADSARAIQYFEHRGKIDVVTHGAQVSPSTPFAIASIGKTMTSVAILRLVARGKIGLDDEVRNWLPARIVSGFGGMRGIRLRHLLNMTSGLPDYLTDDYIDDAAADLGHVQNPRTALSYAFGEDALFQPGEDFDYSNTNYVLAGLILEKASGRRYRDVIRREVFLPAGMTQSFVFGSQALPANFPFGHEAGRHERAYYQHQGFGDGGVISTARDIAMFYRALFIEHSLITPAMMNEMIRDPFDENYGLGIDVDGNIFGHSGGDTGFSSDARINVKTGAIAIMLIAKANADTSWTEDVIRRR